MRARPFTDESLKELLAFLAASHPKAAADSLWASLPEAIQRRVADFVLEPLCSEFVRWDPMAVVRGDMKSLSFGLRLRRRCAIGFLIANDEGVATCGPPMAPGSGVYEVDFTVEELFSLDRFCRADVGVVLDPCNPERNGSGIWWEAGDGDVYVAKDMEGVSPKRAAGWLGDDARVEEGVLPRWDRHGSTIGVVVDTGARRLGFRRDGVPLPFELELPAGGTLHFAVGWSGDTGGTLRIERLERQAPDAVSSAPLACLLTSIAATPSVAASLVRDYARGNPGGLSATVVAEVLEALPADSRPRAAAAAALARAVSCRGACGPFSSAFAASAVRVLRLRSARERLALDLAGLVADPWNYEAAVLAEAVPGLGPAKRARVVSRLWRPRLGRWLRSLAWCCS